MKPAAPHSPAARSYRGILRPISTAWRRLGRDNEAVAALEFALLLPLLLVLYVAGAEVGQAIAIYRKVSLTSYTLADLVSQYSSVCSTSNSNSSQVASLPDILSISTSVMLPYPASGTNMVVAGITNSSGTNTVNWSYGLNATAWTTNAAPPSSLTISSGLFSSSSNQVIVAQAQYTYTSAFAAIMQDIWKTTPPATITLSSTSFVRPRQTSSIGITSC